ncbi:putative tbc1 domain family member 14 [Rosellinia necatrix]|uniref:Putative tbc1 domain family member 14 n=1 Tax=Rosellinia necatrix TaxID=77044 RepID=A0A1W2TU15_ROSNE|nr:putative tbc1 domain family member 14 [Rosellinia necatrix]
MIHRESPNTVELAISRPSSPPGMSSSKSSKASSLHSFHSDVGDSLTASIGHFEEIGLEDHTISTNSPHFQDTYLRPNLGPSPKPNPYMPTFASDLRATATKHVGSRIHAQARDLAHPRMQRDVISLTKARPVVPTLSTQFRDVSTQSLTLEVEPRPRLPNRSLSAHSASSVGTSRRYRSPSPGFLPQPLGPRGPNVSPRPRRSSWQSTREAKSTSDAEKEFDNDDGDDDIPDGLILDNVPLSPRPLSERSSSRPVSASTSPERQPKERVRSVGNGTPAVAVDQGSLKSPTWRSDPAGDAQRSTTPSPAKGRAKSWTAAISGLNAEAKALTEKLEEHADELERRGISRPHVLPPPKPRVKSALAELPPLRRSNIMIDPLPISKEKEAVLSRTRPSWLPPKDPAEEKKHLKAYQKMMASSIEADKKREAARRDKEKNEARIANDRVRIWEEDILSRWDDALREERTQELWWKGIPPRSRGTVWSRAIGNELGLTPASFQAALSRASEVEKRVGKGNGTADDERIMRWFSEMAADVEERTWTELKIFQPGAPLHQSVIDVLRAYSMYRSDIGYVTGCHTIAALLLLNLDSNSSAFIALANVLNRPLPLSFYADDPGARASVCQLVNQTLAIKSPQLQKHITDHTTIGPDFPIHLANIFTSLFTRHAGLDDCTRLWDAYVFEGDRILIHAVVALLLEREMPLLSSQSGAEFQEVLESPSKLTFQDQDDDAFIRRVRDIGK